MADQKLNILISAIDKTQRVFSSVGRGLKAVGRQITSVKGLLVGLGASLALKKFASQIDELAKQSARIGLTVNQLQSLQFAAGQTGAEAETLNKALDRFSRVISETNLGTGIAKRSFEELGITLKNNDGTLKGTDQLLKEVSDGLSQVPNQADRVRIAFDLFGRSGTNLVNLLQGGSGQLKNLRNEFNGLSIELTGEQAKAVEQANDLFDKLGKTFSSLGQQITATVLPALSKVARFITTIMLDAFASVTKAIRTTFNSIIDLTNDVLGTDNPMLSFGEEIERNLERISFNLKNYSDGIRMVERDGKNYKEVIISQTNATNANATAVTKATTKINEYRDAIRGVRTEFDDYPDFDFLLPPETIQPFDMALDTFGEYPSAVSNAKDAVEQFGLTMQDVAQRGIRSLEDAMVDLISGTRSAKDAFADMARSIIRDIIRMQVQQNITQPLNTAISGFFSPTAPAKGLAIGGAVQAGRPYMVGERGAEMFVPNQSGAIVPNDRLGGGNGVIINQTINVSTGVQQTVRAEISQLMPQISEATKAAVMDARRRGGSFSAAFG